MSDLNSFDYFNKMGSGAYGSGLASSGNFAQNDSLMGGIQMFNFPSAIGGDGAKLDISKIKNVGSYVHDFFNSGSGGMGGDDDFMSSMFKFKMPSFSMYGGSFTPPKTNYPPFESKNCDRNVLLTRFNSSFKGNLSGKGAAIIAAADRYGLDPALFASIIANESGYGKYGSGNNFGGLMDPSTGCATKQKFGSVEEGLDRVAANLRKNYINKGLTTPATMGPKYCPVGAANDPTGLNGNWIGGVTRVYQKFTA